MMVITGDLLDNDSRGLVAHRTKPYLSKPVGLLLDQLSHLKAPLGVYAVWGNHDCGYSNLKTFEASLSSLGISVLTNRGASVRRGLFLAGVDDLWWGDPNVTKALLNTPDNAASILLCHNPDYLLEIPQRVSLALCSHTHGGQVRLPGVGAPWVPSKYGERFLVGWVTEPVPAYVSRGLGATAVPHRIGAQAELSISSLSLSKGLKSRAVFLTPSARVSLTLRSNSPWRYLTTFDFVPA